MNIAKNIDISQNIREAAFDLFLEKGYEATNQREIADAAGYKAPSIYFYYKSKKDLFLSVLETIWERHTTDLEGSFRMLGSKGMEALRQIFVMPIHLVAEDCASYRFLFRYRLFPAAELQVEIREAYLKWERTEEELYVSACRSCLEVLQKADLSKSRKVYWYIKKRQLSIINDMLITGEFAETAKIEESWADIRRFIDSIC